MLESCYGIKFNKLESCNNCAHKNYCKDSHEGFSFTDYYSMRDSDIALSVIRDLFYLDVDSGMIFKIFKKLIPIYERNPRTFNIIIKKMLSPDSSYSDIAKLFHVSKIGIHYHIKEALKIVPEIKDALCINQKFKPKSKCI